MKKLSLFLLAFVILAGTTPAWAQNPGKLPGTKWSVSPFEFKVFIENLGQFNGKDKLNGSQVLYSADLMGTNIYYTSTGLTYVIERREVSEEKQREFMEEEAREGHSAPGKNDMAKLDRMADTRRSVIHMEWVGCNTNVQVIPSDKVSEYYNYQTGERFEDQVNYAKGYRSLLYKNLYNNIDVVYTFHEEKGTKYALILHPGADLSQVKMKYTGADNITKDASGNIVLSTIFGPVTDHAPVSFFEDREKVSSVFSLQKNIVSFTLSLTSSQKSKIKNQKLIVDPWTVNPAFATLNRVFKCDNDPAGNLYVYGSNTPFKVRKYDNTGAALWTFNTAWNNGNWFGDLAVDPAGNSYITPGTTNIQKLNTAGVSQWINNAAFLEAFCLEFDLTNANLVCAGAVGASSMARVNMGTGAITGVTNVGNNTSIEIRSLCLAPNNNWYAFTTFGFSGNNPASKILGVTPALGNIFNVLSGHTAANFPYFSPAYCVGAGGLNGGASGENGIAATCNFIYAYEGLNLIKYNIANGTQVGTIAVASGIAGQCSGTQVDSCGNVYVGTSTGISKYNANLGFIKSAACASNVYDICFAPNFGMYAVGNGFVALVDTMVKICPAGSLNYAANSNNASCNTSNGSASVTGLTGGTQPYTYQWSNGQTTANATGLSAGIYTVTVKDASCPILTKTATVQITAASSGTAVILNSNPVKCFGGNNGSATASMNGGVGTLTYSWNPSGATTNNPTNLSAGTYTVTVTDGNGCTSTASVNITQPTALGTTMSATAATCTQGGTTSVTASGGTGSYTYLWNNTQTNQSATGLSIGTYTVTVTDANGCTKTDSISVTGIAGPLAGISNTSNVSCKGGSNGVAMTTTSGGTGTMTYAWSNGQTTGNATALSAGTYTVTVTDSNGCTATATATITEPTLLVATANGINACANATATGAAAGGTAGYNYSWNPSAQTTANATGLATGVYTLTVTDANGCTASDTAIINVSPPPVVLFSANDTAGCVAHCVKFTCSTANIVSYTWNFGDGSTNFVSTSDSANHCYKQTGTFSVTLTIVDNKGCSSTSTHVNMIYVYPNVVADFTASPQPTTILNPVITFTDLSLNGPIIWKWSFGDLLNSTSNLQNPTFNFKDSGCYNVELFADNVYNCPDTVEKIICINGDYELFAPNAFTPDGSGLNDKFNVKGIGIDPNNFKLWIFDRWGNLIFETTDLNEGWDGRANGGRDIAQQDVYVWKVATKDFLGGKHSYIGHVSLVR